MAAQNRYAFLLSEKGDVAKNTNSIYSQLEAPAQRASAAESLQTDLESARTKTGTGTEIVPGTEDYRTTEQRDYDRSHGVTDADYFRMHPKTVTYTFPIPGKEISYQQAKKNSGTAAYQATINPAKLTSPLGDYGSPGNIANAYLNPAAENSYNTGLVFGWNGQIVAGTGSKNPGSNNTNRLMYDLNYGVDREAADYKAAVNNEITSSQYAGTQQQRNTERQRVRYFPPPPVGFGADYLSQRDAEIASQVSSQARTENYQRVNTDGINAQAENTSRQLRESAYGLPTYLSRPPSIGVYRLGY